MIKIQKSSALSNFSWRHVVHRRKRRCNKTSKNLRHLVGVACHLCAILNPLGSTSSSSNSCDFQFHTGLTHFRQVQTDCHLQQAENAIFPQSFSDIVMQDTYRNALSIHSGTTWNCEGANVNDRGTILDQWRTEESGRMLCLLIYQADIQLPTTESYWVSDFLIDWDKL